MSLAADKLRAAGFRVLEGDGVFKVLAPDEPRGTWHEIRQNADGSLALIKERSALHKQIAAVLGC